MLPPLKFYLSYKTKTRGNSTQFVLAHPQKFHIDFNQPLENSLILFLQYIPSQPLEIPAYPYPLSPPPPVFFFFQAGIIAYYHTKYLAQKKAPILLYLWLCASSCSTNPRFGISFFVQLLVCLPTFLLSYYIPLMNEK